jgi:hypothetical protein
MKIGQILRGVGYLVWMTDWLQEQGDPQGELLRLCLPLQKQKGSPWAPWPPIPLLAETVGFVAFRGSVRRHSQRACEQEEGKDPTSLLPGGSARHPGAVSTCHGHQPQFVHLYR